MPDAFIESLTNYVLAGKPRDEPHANAAAAAECAPASLQPLFRALATHWRSEISMHDRRLLGVDLCDFGGVLSAAGITAGSDGWFDPAQSLVIGQMAGGETYCGFAWSDDRVRFVEVDLDTAGVTEFATGVAYLQMVVEDEEAIRLYEGIEPELAGLLRAVGIGIDPDVPRLTECGHDGAWKRPTEPRLDKRHLVAVDDGQVRVTDPKGVVVASAPFAGSEVFVTDGRIFGLVEEFPFTDLEAFEDEQEHGYAVWRWDGEALHAEGITRVGHSEDGPGDPDLFNAAAVVDGDQLVGVADEDDNVTWYRYCPDR